MIGRLRGSLLWKEAPLLLLDVHGVGYEVEVPLTTFYHLPKLGEPLELHTHLVVREDAHLLYGFAVETDRALFRALIKVSGVGAKLALAILSSVSAEEFARCVHSKDIASLTRIPGIGKKTAERLVVEMRDRLTQEKSPVPTSSAPGPLPTLAATTPIQDAISALVALGYKPLDASRMVRAVDNEGLACEEIIRRALQGVGK